jgi:hypothetical protein
MRIGVTDLTDDREEIIVMIVILIRDRADRLTGHEEMNHRRVGTKAKSPTAQGKEETRVLLEEGILGGD